MEAAKRLEAESATRAADLEEQLKDAANVHERQSEVIKKEMARLKEASAKSRAEWQMREQESETLNLEITELRKTIEAGRAQLRAGEEKLTTLRGAALGYEGSLKEIRERVSALRNEMKTRKEEINRKNRDLQKLSNRKEEIAKRRADAELEIKKLEHEIAGIESTAADSEAKIRDFLRRYDWIERDEAYFGKAGKWPIVPEW